MFESSDCSTIFPVRYEEQSGTVAILPKADLRAIVGGFWSVYNAAIADRLSRRAAVHDGVLLTLLGPCHLVVPRVPVYGVHHVKKREDAMQSYTGKFFIEEA